MSRNKIKIVCNKRCFCGSTTCPHAIPHTEKELADGCLKEIDCGKQPLVKCISLDGNVINIIKDGTVIHDIKD